MDDAQLLDALRPQLAALFERHLATTREWFPHAVVPWERAAGLDPDQPWDESRSTLPPAVRSALFVNLLTEDNLPYYFETINRVFGDEAWREWARRWTAEEMRHSIAIRDYVTVSGALDPVALERARMAQVATGEVPQPPTVIDGLVYVALQELATRISHRNTGKLLDDPAGYTVMARVAADENLHHLFYRDLVSAAIEIDPAGAVCAIERQVREFEMPGTGITGFTAHAAAIAAAGIYDLAIHHDQILVPVVLHHWRVDRLEGLPGDADAARSSVLGRIERIGAIGRRRLERRQAVAAGV